MIPAGVGIDDEGLQFTAEMQFADLVVQTRVTASRGELLAWIRQHTEAGGTLLALGMTARGPGRALSNMLLAVTLGEMRRLAAARTPPPALGHETTCDCPHCQFRREYGGESPP